MTKAEQYRAAWEEAQRQRDAVPSPKQPAYEYETNYGAGLATVQPGGDLFVQGHHGVPVAAIPGFIAWLRETYGHGEKEQMTKLLHDLWGWAHDQPGYTRGPDESVKGRFGELLALINCL